MKQLAFTLGLIASLQLSPAQQPASPAAPPPTTPAPATPPPTQTPPAQAPPAGNPTVPDNPNAPRNPDPGNVPPDRTLTPTNPPTSQPFPNFSTENRGQSANTNQPGMTNQQPTAGLGTTNTATTNAGPRANFAITNTLASMSQVQAQNVIQVQNSLNNLQNSIVNIGGIQNVQQIIQQNPRVQQQVQQISKQISGLAHGPVRPSTESVQRLSTDLLHSCSRGRLAPDAQLVIAVVVNQACNSGRLSADQVNGIVNNALGTLQQAGVPLSVAHTVGCDLHSIAFELQPNLGM